MSKWSEDFEKQLKDTKTIRRATKDVLEKGGNLAFEELHNARSLEKLKQMIKEKY